MELRDALSQIAEIRQQMARGQIFRGYRSATTAFSGSLALLAGILQAAFISDPQNHPQPFILLWVSAAMISLIVVGAEMIVRTRRSNSQVQRQLSLLAVEQFMPSVAAGALVTWVFCDFLREQVSMLPGLWMVLFSLGIFASARLLPRAVFAVGGFYLVCGILTLVAAGKGLAFSPWLMAGTFGVGQFSTAMILYTRLERVHE
jgi:hypothetical protein